MILKVADYSQALKGKKLSFVKEKIANTANDISWWFFDGISRAKVSYYHNNAAAHLAYGDELDALFTDVQHVQGCTCSGEISDQGYVEGCSDCVNTAVVSCRLEDGNEFIIMLDTRAYLLNNNGKTIETVVCNYLN